MLNSKLTGLTEREISEDKIFLGTAQENNNQADTSHMTEAESLVVYILSNFTCGQYNGELRNASEVLQSVDSWLQDKDRGGYMRAKSEIK